MVHMDLKPDNVFGSVLGDLGLAHLAGRQGYLVAEQTSFVDGIERWVVWSMANLPVQPSLTDLCLTSHVQDHRYGRRLFASGNAGAAQQAVRRVPRHSAE
jgi:hypothetical protein